MPKSIYQRAFASCEVALKERGVHLEMVQDFGRVPEIALELGYPFLTPNLSPNHNTFTKGNCFWLLARDEEGLAAACAVRCDDIEDEPFGDYWHRLNARYYRDTIPAPELKIHDALNEGLYGRLCYWGALKSRTRKYSLKNLELISKAGQMLAAQKWLPDFTYAFIQDHRLEQRAHILYGFCSFLPNSHQWINPPQGRNTEEVCVYSSLDQLQMVAENIVGDTSSMQ